MPFSDLVFFFLLMVLIGWSSLAFYMRRRDVNYGLKPSGDRIFLCKECDYVYTDDEDVERSLCPECGKMNNPVQF